VLLVAKAIDMANAVHQRFIRKLFFDSLSLLSKPSKSTTMLTLSEMWSWWIASNSETSFFQAFLVEIDWYGFFLADISAICGPIADTIISIIHGPIPVTNISKIRRSCFLLHYQKCNVLYALPFFEKLQKSGFMS